MITILIVEDEEAIANLIRMNLVKAGYQCETASDGEEAADKIANRDYDLILLDIMLPKLNGYEVLEYVPEFVRNDAPRSVRGTACKGIDG